MSIYTKKGDNGKSSTLDGRIISKSSPIFNALGSLDEVNSWLGMIGGYRSIQKDIMTISGILAGAKLTFPKEKTEELEKKIDRLEKKLPKLTGFVVPRGKSAKIHFARALVRRAERAVVSLPKAKPEILVYLNRLSDYFFVEAREKAY